MNVLAASSYLVDKPHDCKAFGPNAGLSLLDRRSGIAHAALYGERLTQGGERQELACQSELPATRYTQRGAKFCIKPQEAGTPFRPDALVLIAVVNLNMPAASKPWRRKQVNTLFRCD
jgi:hypothetical protein